MASMPKILNALFSPLGERQKEVLVGRFGLGKSGGETLAAIGGRMGITRERVRQIEASALEIVRQRALHEAACVQILSHCKKYLKNAGGVMEKTAFFKSADFLEGLGENHLDLLLAASGAFRFHPEDDDYRPFYYLSESELRSAENFIGSWIDFLRERKDAVLGGSYEKPFADFAKSKRLSMNCAENYIGVTKKIGVNPYGDFGLKEWEEINPSTTRERIYLVLKKKGAPLHFESIAKAINEAGLGTQAALAPTVHNELIKDPRFVLVGRGMYGLKEHGYEPGVAYEVIQRILRKHGPMKTAEVIEHVQKQRFFKPNTIAINLQNKNYFERLGDGRYKVREA